MRAFVLVTALLLGAAGAGAVGMRNLRPHSYYEAKFYDWLAKYDVKFDTGDEYARALQNFADADDFISTHDAASAGFTMAHNAYSHLSWSEFRQLKGIGRPLQSSPNHPIFPANPAADAAAVADAAALEAEVAAATAARRRSLRAGGDDAAEGDDEPTLEAVDWSGKGGVTPVKNQGGCGSCWSFSATGALEGAYFVKYGKLESFSEQELVDCDTYDSGCNGGLMDYSFHWIQKNGGLCREDDYPYTGDGSEACRKRSCDVVSGSAVASWVDVPSNMNALMQAVARQPVAVAIEADEMSFQFYSGGVLTASCGTSLDHGVLLVGYGETDDGTKYWKVKNSWGADWGDHGFIKLERGAPQQGGECGILMQVS
ncbi:unnamed protein product, partial [Phaeothamnion confervicola]